CGARSRRGSRRAKRRVERHDVRGHGELFPMSVPAAAQREPADVAMLTGTEAGGMIAGALEPDGSRLLDWQVHTVHHRPGAGVTVGYTATVERPAPSGPVRAEEYICATTAQLSHTGTPGLVRLG